MSRNCNPNLTQDPPCISGLTSGVRRVVSAGVIVCQPRCQQLAVGSIKGGNAVDRERNPWWHQCTDSSLLNVWRVLVVVAASEASMVLADPSTTTSNFSTTIIDSSRTVSLLHTGSAKCKISCIVYRSTLTWTAVDYILLKSIQLIFLLLLCWHNNQKVNYRDSIGNKQKEITSKNSINNLQWSDIHIYFGLDKSAKIVLRNIKLVCKI